MRWFWLCCILISEQDFYLLHCLLLFPSLSNSGFFTSLCVNPSRCSTGSATTRSCSCRATQRSVWATNTPWTCRHSTTTLPWIPWWVEGAVSSTGGQRGQHMRPPPILREWGTWERWCKEGQAGCGSSSVALSSQTLMCGNFLDLRAA